APVLACFPHGPELGHALKSRCFRWRDYKSAQKNGDRPRLSDRAFRILQGQAQLFRQRIGGRAGTLPRTVRFEPDVADAAAPRRDDAADGAEVRAVLPVLIQAADDVGRDADERAQRRRRADAVLAAVPRRREQVRDLLEVIHEEALRLFAERLALASGPERLAGQQLLELLRERGLRHTPAADAQQLDVAVERRVLAVVERADDVVRGGQILVAVELTARE